MAVRIAVLYNPTIPEAHGWAERAAAIVRGDLFTEPPEAGRIVVVGGDGTIHAVANARPGAEIAIVPCGSGNDFVKTLGIPCDAESALRLIAGPARPVDVVEYECAPGRRGRYLNIAEVGFGARVVAHAAKLRKVTGRRMSYRLGIVTALAGHRLSPITLDIDGRRVGEYLMTNLIVANGQYFGSGMRPMPDARPDDGLLDIAILNEFGRWKILSQAKVLRSGLPKNHQKIHHFRGREVRVTSPAEVAVEADGEVLGNIPACFRVIPHGLRVVCP
ncbi:MAG: diacylglycerol kinase family lipid kinase [Planctomycetes bacterium]|nr:diacylglycerol kinase family lipid kinase [Planctomycetota bacterium]